MFGTYLKYALCALFISVTYAALAAAAPAAPGWRTYTQPSGETFVAGLRGDEYFNFTVRATQEAIDQDPAGIGSYPAGEYTIGQDARGVWYYAQEYVNPNDSIALQVLSNTPAHLPPPDGITPRILPELTKTVLPGTTHLQGMSLTGGIGAHRVFLRPANPTNESRVSLALYTPNVNPCFPVTSSATVSGNTVTMEIIELPPTPNMACIQISLPRLDPALVGKLTAGNYNFTITKSRPNSYPVIPSEVVASGVFTIASQPTTPGTFDAPTTVPANPDGSFKYTAIYTPATPTSFMGVTIRNVSNTTAGLYGDGLCMAPASMNPHGVGVSGNLIDLTKNGVVSISYSSCNGDHFDVETTITPPAPVDPCISNPTGPGCPQGDDDNDGVKNGLDQCPGTDPANAAPGTMIDPSTGCFIVTVDPCTATPTAAGCPAGDDDNDGVQNSRDRCAGTASGVRVNRAGCPALVRKPPHHRGDSD